MPSSLPGSHRTLGGKRLLTFRQHTLHNHLDCSSHCLILPHMEVTFYRWALAPPLTLHTVTFVPFLTSAIHYTTRCALPVVVVSHWTHTAVLQVSALSRCMPYLHVYYGCSPPVYTARYVLLPTFYDVRVRFGLLRCRALPTTRRSHLPALFHLPNPARTPPTCLHAHPVVRPLTPPVH